MECIKCGNCCRERHIDVVWSDVQRWEKEERWDILREISFVKGTGFKYGNSLTINMVSAKDLKDPDTDTPVGVRMKLQTTKNLVAYKGRFCFLDLYFNHGIDKYGGIQELLVQYDLAKASSKAKVSGEYTPTTTFTYTPPCSKS